VCAPAPIGAGTIRHCVWIVRGRVHPQTPRDIPLKVANYLPMVAEVLHGIDERRRER